MNHAIFFENFNKITSFNYRPYLDSNEDYDETLYSVYHEQKIYLMEIKNRKSNERYKTVKLRMIGNDGITSELDFKPIGKIIWAILSYKDGKPVILYISDINNYAELVFLNIENGDLVRDKATEEELKLIYDLKLKDLISFEDTNNYSYFTNKYISNIKEGVEKNYPIAEN